MRYLTAVSTVGICLITVSTWLDGCAQRSAVSPSSTGTTLLGRWVARPAGAPCDFELELMQGGLARTNYLNDDSPKQLCAMHSLGFSAGSPVSDTLDFWVGRQVVRYCFYRLSGPTLALVCDEHRPPDRSTPPLQFTRARTLVPPS